MKTIFMLFAALLVGGGQIDALAQQSTRDASRLLGSNAEGFHFMVGFMQNEVEGCIPEGFRAVSIASRFATNITVILPDGQVVKTSVPEYGIASVEIPRAYECIGEGVFHKGIEIIADRPVSVACYSLQHTTSEGYLALPVSSWGTEYLSANYYADHYAPDDSPFASPCLDAMRPGELAVLAAEDSTVVTVWPRTRTLRGVAAGAPYTKLLRKGDIFQVQDGGTVRRIGGAPGTDLSGSVITSNKPVGLLSGHVRAAVTSEFESKDHLIEMLPPRNTLGKRYFAVPFGGRQGGDVVRVISAVSKPTKVTFAGVSGSSVTGTLVNLGEFLDININEVTTITAEDPVLVVQYSRSMMADPRNRPNRTVAAFDPYMIVLTPEEQFVNAAVFQTLPNENVAEDYHQFDHHFVTLVAERKLFPTIEIDGKPMLGSPGLVRGDITGTPFMWATLEMAQGSTHVITGDALFGGYIYGIGNVDAYGLPVGSGLRKFDIEDKSPPKLFARPQCGGYEIIAKDSGRSELGLVNFWMDSAASKNAWFEKALLIRGDEFSLGKVGLIDARLPGFIRIYAEDMSLHRDTLELVLEDIRPMFSRDSIDMGQVDVNQTLGQSLVITNPAGPNGVAMMIDSIRVLKKTEFILDKQYNRISIGPDSGTVAVTVKFMSAVRKTCYDTLLVYANCQVYRTPMVARMATPQIATHDLDFGKVRVGRDSCMKLRVWNSGSVRLELRGATFEGTGFTSTFKLAAPVMLAVGADTLLDVCFHPTRTGPFDASVTFASNAENVAIAKLIGVGIEPRITVGGYDFGSLQVGDTACTMIPIANTGTDNAYLTKLELENITGFIPDQSPFPVSLAPGDTLWVPVCFSPREERGYTSNIFPENTDGLEASNTLLGRGYELRATISGGDMGDLWVGDEHDSVVYVTNLAKEAVRIDSVWISGGDVGDFMVVEPLQAPVVVQVGERLPVKVRFSPLGPGYRSCLIYGRTSSNITPLVDSVLWGFGRMALSSDKFDFDTSTAFACGGRGGRVTIFNDGNTPLTLAGISLESSPSGATLQNAPPVGYKIAIGESVSIDFDMAFKGYEGTTSGKVVWSFEELPGPFAREFSVETKAQQCHLSATAPASVGVGNEFDLNIRVDSTFWKSQTESKVELEIAYDSTFIMFDAAQWKPGTSVGGSAWATGEAAVVRPGVVLVSFVPADGLPVALDNTFFPPVPFRVFIGEHRLDTLQITMASASCTPMSLASVPVSADSICGLSTRLFRYTGDPFLLKQNNPNPVDNTTIIEFTLAMEGSTRLELFASNGDLVATPIDATLAAGDYTITINGNELASGLYLYRLTSGPYTATRQMHVVK